MKLIVILSLIALSSGAKLNRAYLPPSHAHTSSGSDLLETPIVVSDGAVSYESSAELTNLHNHQQAEYVQIGNHGHSAAEDGHHAVQDDHEQHYHAFAHAPERAQAALERNAAILRQQFENNVDSYSYVYETQNGIYGEESGVATHGVRAQGGYSYTGDDGKLYSISYTADENGFRPQGDHIPTPHPIPEEILKSLEENARDEAAGIFDDGSYSEEKYGDKTEHSHIGHAHSVVVNEQTHAVNNAEAIVTDSGVLSSPVSSTNGHVEYNHLNTVAHIPQVIVQNPNKVYLPPSNLHFVNGVRKTYSAPVQHHLIGDSGSEHVIVNNDVRKTYVHPVHSQIVVNSAAHKTYLPPASHQVIEDRSSQSGIAGQVFVPVQRQTIVRAGQVARKTYLPPHNGQIIEDRSSQNGQFAFGARTHQPSFNSKSGYKY